MLKAAKFTMSPGCKNIVMKGIQALRRILLRYWKKTVILSFVRWFDAQKLKRTDIEYVRSEGIRAIKCAGFATWWEWKRGSRLFFWRWPKDFQELALYGAPPFVYRIAASGFD